MFCDIAKAYWWCCDDIANALEVPAENLLSHLTEEEMEKEVFVEDIVSHVSQWAGKPYKLMSDIRASLPQKDLEKKRFISHKYLERIVEINGTSAIVNEFKGWLTEILPGAEKSVTAFDALCVNMDRYIDLSLMLRHLLFALDGEALKTQFDRLILETEANLALLKFFKFGYEKDILLHQN